MPACTFQDVVERGARTHWWRHGAKRARMRFFLERAFPQKFLHILFTGESTLGLLMKFGFLPFFRGFHPANGDFGSSNFVPPAAEPTLDRVLQKRRFRAEVSEFFFPAPSMELFRFGHVLKDAFAFFVSFALDQLALRVCDLHFR